MRPRTKYLLALALILTVLTCFRLGVASRAHVINVLLVISCVVAYVYLAFSAFALRPKMLGLLLGTLLSVPTAVLILASPSILIFAFVALKDFAAGPDTVMPMGDGLICAQYSSGTAFSEATETFELDRTLLGVLLLRLASDSGPILEDYSVEKGCASVYRAWKSSGRTAATL